MQGTRVSLTRPMRPMPPRITSPVSTATTSPTASRSQPKAASREAAMELACTTFPPPREAATQHRENRAASVRLPTPRSM